MADHFTKLIGPLIEREGGYVNHVSDRGGETNHGITILTARRFGYKGPMKAMPKAEAVRIYREQYWVGPGCEEVAYLSLIVADELFDIAVNMGVAWPGVFIQRALNVFNRKGADYPDLMLDGDIGPATLKALSAYLKKRGLEGEGVLVSALKTQKGERYLSITEGRQANEDFVYGWFRTRVGAFR